MTQQQKILTIAVDLRRLAHALLVGSSEQKINYLLNEVKNTTNNCYGLPKKIIKIISMANLNKIKPPRIAAENFLTVASILRLRCY